ncbi:MAG TPA: ABC transporter permease [Ohtaekwangia sp.]|nr:ABC transporter permease [Ohtaekwangia sp.]
MAMTKRTLQPPRSAQKLLLWFLRDDLAEEVLGDLDEKFLKMATRRSPVMARLNYWYQVLHYVRPFAIRRPTQERTNHFDMFQSYFNVGWRNLFRNKGYSLINIGGLTVGMAVAMLIGLWIFDELSYNHHHRNYERIARVMRHGTVNGETFTTTWLPYPLGEELRTKYGESFKHVLMASPPGSHILTSGDKKLNIQGAFIDPGAPEVFTFNMVRGNRDGLTDLQSILLSATLARKLFGDEDPIDKVLLIDNRTNVKVTGVYEDLPHNTHFHGVQFFAPWELYVSFNEWMKWQGFGNNFLDIYVELSPNTNLASASDLIKNAILDNVQDDKGYVAINPQLLLHPMQKWHLYSAWNNGVNTGGLIQFVWLFAIVGSFVLLLACINFMNLSTARSEKRVKEVGIRKTIGSVRNQLINQFFFESLLVVVIAFLLAMAVAAISISWFNDLAGKKMTMPWGNYYFWLAATGFIIFTGLVAGSYPALYLSSFKPIQALKGGFRAGRLASLPRKVLVVIQFTVSVVLITGTIIVYQQIQFAKNRPVGYNREGLLMIQMTTRDFHANLDVLHTELEKSGVVAAVGESIGPVTDVWASNGGFDWRDKDPALQTEFATLAITAGYGETVGWQFLKGRDFSRELASDSLAMVINETAAKLMGFEDPIGEEVRWKAGWTTTGQYNIIGVIQDMVMESPFSPPIPTVFFLNRNVSWMNIKISPEATASEALPKIEAVFKKVIPSVPFDYKFAGQEYMLKFSAEERIGTLSSVFAVLAIFISCLGLFGLASFVAEQRTREIGIRKVVGASVFNLWRLLSRDFVLLVIISCLLAVPIAHYLMSSWLQKYAYRVEISWWVFFITSVGAFLITLLTVSYQAIKAATLNPVKSLKTE